MERVCQGEKALNPLTGRCVAKNYLNKVNKAPKQPKVPKEKVPKQPKVPKEKVPKPPKVPKEKVPKPPKVPKVPKEKVPKKPKMPHIVNNKLLIINNLKILEEYEKLNKQPFKARAYNKVIDALELYENQINTPDDIKTINGIGDKIESKILEFLSTGKMAAVEKALADPKSVSYTHLTLPTILLV